MINIISVEKNNNNGKLIMLWRNDPITRENSFDTDPKIWNSFKNEFYNNYFNNIPLFALLDNEKIAFISFIYTDKLNTLEIGINIAPEYRGKGLAYDILKCSINYIKEYDKNIRYIVARIKDFNVSSIKLFTKNNFHYINNYIFNNQNINKYIYDIYSHLNGVPNSKS